MKPDVRPRAGYDVKTAARWQASEYRKPTHSSCLLACLPACLPACLLPCLACLLACLLALLACLPACLFAYCANNFRPPHTLFPSYIRRWVKACTRTHHFYYCVINVGRCFPTLIISISAIAVSTCYIIILPSFSHYYRRFSRCYTHSRKHATDRRVYDEERVFGLNLRKREPIRYLDADLLDSTVNTRGKLSLSLSLPSLR